MIAYIKGSLEMKLSDSVVIDVSGVGYKIYMAENAIQNIGEISDIVKVYTYYYVREDNISLYGFLTNEEEKMFELLLSVSGIGAKSAITMLANITPSSFALAVITNDTSKLVKIPGIGAKTAARIILELKDKLKTESAISKQDEQIKTAIDKNEKTDEAISALLVLGYNRKQIEDALQKIEQKDLKLEDIIRQALAILGK